MIDVLWKGRRSVSPIGRHMSSRGGGTACLEVSRSAHGRPSDADLVVHTSGTPGGRSAGSLGGVRKRPAQPLCRPSALRVVHAGAPEMIAHSLFRLTGTAAMVTLPLPSSAASSQSPAATAIDGFMSRATEYGQFNGAIMVVDHGRIVYERAFGLANMQLKVPNTTTTRFEIASMTKPMTAIAIMQLVQEGTVRLDGKISDHLPWYPSETGRRITVEQLLEHTSGIPQDIAFAGHYTVIRSSTRDRRRFSLRCGASSQLTAGRRARTRCRMERDDGCSAPPVGSRASRP